MGSAPFKSLNAWASLLLGLAFGLRLAILSHAVCLIEFLFSYVMLSFEQYEVELFRPFRRTLNCDDVGQSLTLDLWFCKRTPYDTKQSRGGFRP